MSDHTSHTDHLSQVRLLRGPLALALASVLVCSALFVPGTVHAAVLTLQQGAPIGGLGATSPMYDGAEDVMLIQWAAANNFGGRGDFDVGKNGGNTAHSLLRFDLTPLEEWVSDHVRSVNSITLQLTVKNLYTSNPVGTVHAHLLADANAGWVEGTYATADGQSSTPNDGFSTWNYRQRTTQTWAGSVGAGAAGTDYVAPSLGSKGYNASATPVGTKFTLNLGDGSSFLETWVSGGTNAGFFLRESSGTSSNRINFHSKEAGTVSHRPILIIDYNPQSYYAAAIHQGLLGHWHFDQVVGTRAFDSTTNYNHATFTGLHETNSWRTGVLDGALDLNGQNGHASGSIPQANGLSELTMSVWAKRESSMNDHAGIWLHRTGTTPDVTGFNIAVDADKKLQFRVMGAQLNSVNGTFAADGDWYHLAGTWKQGELMELYLDGERVAWTDSNVPNTLLTGDDLWRFGFDTAGSNRYFNGQVDDAAMWGRVLEPAEILALYNGGLQGINAAMVPEPGTWLMLLAAAACGLLVRRRRGKD